MKIYYYPKCTTCKSAVQFLQNRQAEFVAIDIKQQPPSIEELKKMVQFYQGDFKRLFNTSGVLYRELRLKDQLLSVEDALVLLHQNGMLIKRPFLLAQNGGLVGFKEKEWKKIV